MIELSAEGILEQTFATEIMGCIWRLRRCRVAESDLAGLTGKDPMVCPETSDDKSERTQKNIDRARAQSHYLLRRSIAELRILQTERTTRLQLKVQGDLPGVTSTKQLLSTLKMDAAQDTKAPGSVASFCKPEEAESGAGGSARPGRDREAERSSAAASFCKPATAPDVTKESMARPYPNSAPPKTGSLWSAKTRRETPPAPAVPAGNSSAAMEIPPRRSRTKPPEWWDRRFRRSKNSTHSEIMYKQVKFRFLTALFLALPAPAADLIDFNTQIHPILAARCLICHSQEKRSGGLSLATYKDALDGGRSGADIRPGSSASSLLLKRITGENEPRMPLGGTPLTPDQTALIARWIDEGARPSRDAAPAKPKWEAPLTLTAPPVPDPAWPAWHSPLVSTYLAQHKLPEPAQVSDAVFARRVSLDIQGLLPDPAELQAFLKDQSPDKRRKLIESLLADNRKYAENWISFWNDLLRNDEGVNYYSETASRKTITPWLLGALESNLPYDRFVLQLLNPVTPTDPEGFLIGVNWRGTVSASQTPALQAAQNTAQIFLGINLKCNSCHDSFISHWKLKDAYSLAAYFSPDPRLQLYRCDVAQPQFAEPAFLFPELSRPPASASLPDRHAAAAAIFLDPRDGRLARTLVNRIWERMTGRGIVGNSDEMDGEPWSPELLDWLAADFVLHKYDLKHLIATIAESRAYQMPAVPGKSIQPAEYTFRGPEIRRLTAEQFADAIGAITGDWHVTPGNPGHYTREWHTAASSLTHALGRPIRDQVYSTRDTQATTLQALELVNGETLTHWLNRGARRMLGELPSDPASLFYKPYVVKNGPVPFDIDISKSRKLWLVLQDTGSYSPEKVQAIWSKAAFTGPNGTVPVGDPDGLRVKTPSVEVLDIAGKGYTRLTGAVTIENREVTSELNPQIRFFVFDQPPNMERLTPVAPETPLPAPPPLRDAGRITDRIFWYALGRAPSAAERNTALQAIGHPDADGLADLLWAILMKPEFQLIP